MDARYVKPYLEPSLNGTQVEGYPVPSVRWMKNNAKLPRSQRIFVEEDNILVIKSASPIGRFFIIKLPYAAHRPEVRSAKSH